MRSSRSLRSSNQGPPSTLCQTVGQKNKFQLTPLLDASHLSCISVVTVRFSFLGCQWTGIDSGCSLAVLWHREWQQFQQFQQFRAWRARQELSGRPPVAEDALSRFSEPVSGTSKLSVQAVRGESPARHGSRIFPEGLCCWGALIDVVSVIPLLLLVMCRKRCL